MNKHNLIRTGYDLDMWERYGQRMPIDFNLSKNLHGLVCGSSGSGKSYLILMLLRNFLLEYKSDIKLWFMDFKGSDDFDFMKDYPLYYSGTNCSTGIEDFYQEYEQVKHGEIKDGVIRLMIFDEWAGFQIWQTQQSKKSADMYRGYLLEILLMGRSMLCGTWIIMQRNDAKYLDGRDQFFVTIALGKMSREMKLMIMQGEELEQKEIYQCGEGIIRLDSIGTKFLKVPRLRDIPKVKQQILTCLS